MTKALYTVLACLHAESDSITSRHPSSGKKSKKVDTMETVPASSSHQEEGTPSRSESASLSLQEQTSSSLRDNEFASASPTTQDPILSGPQGESPADRHGNPPRTTHETVLPDHRASGTATPPTTRRPHPLLRHDYYCYFVLPLLMLIFGVLTFHVFRRMRHAR